MRAYFFGHNEQKMRGEVYNIVAENRNIHEVIAIIREFLPDTEMVVSPAPHENHVSYKLSSDKIFKLGFDFQYSIADGIESIAMKFAGIKT
jgi:nucleoside-diphosphate-sugar epimerase